jgi:lipopolysaccharide assembly protein A
MPAQTSPPRGAARPLPPPSANGSVPSPLGAARLHRPILRTRISGIRTALIAGLLALIVLVIFTVQNAQAVKLSFLGAQVRLSLGFVLLLATIAAALLMAAAGTARITQLRRATRRGQPPAPATPGRQATAPGRKEQRPC